MHIRIQQRNGRKSLTTVQGLKKEFSYNKILKDLKKEFCCNGTVVQDPELGQVPCLLMLLNILENRKKTAPFPLVAVKKTPGYRYLGDLEGYLVKCPLDLTSKIAFHF